MFKCLTCLKYFSCLIQKRKQRREAGMGLLRAFCCFLTGSSFGILLFAGTAFAEANIETASLETTDECLVQDRCVEQYLYSLYERTPKIDTVKISKKKKVKVR